MSWSDSVNTRLRHARIRLAGLPSPVTPRVCYGHALMPTPADTISGGLAKFLHLLPAFPHAPYRFNMLYLGSSSLPADWKTLLRLARAKGARVVWNQNGVAYPAWAGEETGKINAYLRRGLHGADLVIYQSRFCKESADRFLGAFAGECRVVHNPVDVSRFRPAAPPPAPQPLRVLSAGTFTSWQRFELAARTVAAVRERVPATTLLVAGKLAWESDARACRRQAATLLRELGLGDGCRYVLDYSRSQAADVFRQAHVLLHTQVMDACPCTVLEAMACGLPVVYIANGGVPELVGDDAGIGVEDGSDFSVRRPPPPSAMADGVARVAGDLAGFSRAARTRAIERFSATAWVERHRQLFERLLRSPPPGRR